MISAKQNSLFDTGCGAHFSACGRYRYALWRIWDDSLAKVMCIGLNPSTANATKNDNTISLLIAMLKQLGFGGFYMANLFAWISSSPEDLLTCADPVAENDYYLQQIKQRCNVMIACWGSFKQADSRSAVIKDKFPEMLCFGKNRNGTPWHPRALLYNGSSKRPVLLSFTG